MCPPLSLGRGAPLPTAPEKYGRLKPEQMLRSSEVSFVGAVEEVEVPDGFQA